MRGAIVRGDTMRRRLAIVFTGDEYADGGEAIRQTLKKYRVPASFFLTGRFYRNPVFQPLIRNLRKDGHYLGPHSNNHLLYCDWIKRDSLFINQTQFRTDLARNYAEMQAYGIANTQARYFLPPYEWYNDTIARWTQEEGLQLINFTPGTLSHADYTTPDLKNYRSSRTILTSIYTHEQRQPSGLNGFILLMHIGTHPARTDKLYMHLEELLHYLQQKRYQLIRVDNLLP
ncbi:polysaccharide deacetylase family protein [Larkinella harenae]